MNIQNLYKLFLKSGTVSTDSRKINKNDIFWALKGDNFDGNNYVQEVLNTGAAFAVSDSEINQNIKNVIYVKDSLKALQELANFHRKKTGIKIIALTGTNGKTTTKELIARVLSAKYKIKATKGNLNNHIGVPLTLLSFNKSLDFGITEMGANHPEEIRTLCKIAEPDFGLITNIGKAHLEGFGSFEGLKNTKKEIYDYLKEKGIIFYNRDNNLLQNLINDHNTISYGTQSNADYQIEFIAANPFVSLKIKSKETCIIESKLIGSYNFENIAAAVSLGLHFNVPLEEIKSAVENYIPENNRSQIIQKGRSFIISDAYNANPSSIEKALENFIQIKAENKVIIFGDMFEMGEYAELEHENVVEKLLLQKENFSEIFTAGNEFRKAVKKRDKSGLIKAFNKTEELIEYIKNMSFSDTWFLIKGSRGMQMETIIKYLRIT